jgi:hypothetical protein
MHCILAPHFGWSHFGGEIAGMQDVYNSRPKETLCESGLTDVRGSNCHFEVFLLKKKTSAWSF